MPRPSNLVPSVPAGRALVDVRLPAQPTGFVLVREGKRGPGSTTTFAARSPLRAAQALLLRAFIFSSYCDKNTGGVTVNIACQAA